MTFAAPSRPAASIAALVASTAACSPPFSLPGQAADAAVWADVQLPDAALPDGFILTLRAPDGSTASIDPSRSCSEPMDATSALDALPPSDSGFPASDGGMDALACAAPAGPGDLVFDEVMISTEPGSSDRGQWLEVRSTRGCATDLVGLHASAPHGQTFRTMDVATDVWLKPSGFFLIADTTDPTENNALPGLVFAWAGEPADALHKTSDTITLSLGDVTLDTLSYPSKKRVTGTSMSFPAGCAPSLRTDFSNWVPSTASWTAGLYGTPGAPNTDVACAVATLPSCGAGARSRR